MSIPNLIAVCHLKGGVGKTTVTTNLAGLYAASGKRVLIVDLDGQAHCSKRLGHQRTNGRELFDAIARGDDPVITPSIRPGLDLMAGGIEVDRLISYVGSTDSMRRGIENALSPIARNYDLIFVDMPPKGHELIESIFGIARAFVSPTDLSFDAAASFEDVRDIFLSARNVNPDLRFLGVILFKIGAGHTDIRRKISEEIHKMFGSDYSEAVRREKNGEPYDLRKEPVFRSFIRAQDKTAQALGERGMLFQELADEAKGAAGWWTDHLGTVNSRPKALTNADKVFEDFIAVAQELIDRMGVVVAEERQEVTI